MVGVQGWIGKGGWGFRGVGSGGGSEVGGVGVVGVQGWMGRGGRGPRVGR